MKKECISAYFDPYGRVFDAVSLEPLDEGMATVVLLDENGTPVNLPSNYDLIDKTGRYNIFLEKDGKYKLTVQGLKDHTFERVNLDQKVSLLYDFIYLPGDSPFEEKASSPKRVDLPVKPKSTPYKRKVDWVFKNQQIVVLGSEQYLKIEFRVTHPLTKIKANTAEFSCEETNLDITNKNGFCTMLIPVKNIPQEGISIELIKKS